MARKISESWSWWELIICSGGNGNERQALSCSDPQLASALGGDKRPSFRMDPKDPGKDPSFLPPPLSLFTEVRFQLRSEGEQASV